jgi:hypothetical protein
MIYHDTKGPVGGADCVLVLWRGLMVEIASDVVNIPYAWTRNRRGTVKRKWRKTARRGKTTYRRRRVVSPLLSAIDNTPFTIWRGASLAILYPSDTYLSPTNGYSNKSRRASANEGDDMILTQGGIASYDRSQLVPTSNCDPVCSLLQVKSHTIFRYQNPIHLKRVRKYTPLLPSSPL